MPKTNIPTSLSTSTQIPVDGKTYKNTLSEITTVTAELAFTYYAGMVITVAQNNKQYIWKQGAIGETPVSNSYTYPNGQIVEGYDYSNKTFAFYEYIINSVTPGPEPDDRIIYKTDGINEAMPNLSMFKTTYQNLFSKKTQSSIGVDNYVTEFLHFRPLASNTIQIYGLSSGLIPNNENPIWFELYPDNAIPVGGPNSKYPGLQEAIDAGETKVILQPTPGSSEFIIETPINSDLEILIPRDLVIKGPVSGIPIFTGGTNKKQGVKLLNGSTLTLESPIATLNGDSEFTLVGEGIVKAENITSPLIKANIGNVKVDIKGIQLDTLNTTIGDFSEGINVNVSDVKFKSTNTTKSLFDISNATMKMQNIELDLDHAEPAPVIKSLNASVIDINNIKASGSITNIFTVAQGTEFNSPKISLNNSNLDSLEASSLFSGIDGNEGVYAANLKVNNTLFANDNVVTNSPSGIKTTNSVVDGTIPDNPGISDAPSDGNTFARRNGNWVEISPGTGGDVSKAYVDAQDLLLSNRIGDNVLRIEDLEAVTVDLTGRVVALEATIGTGLQRFVSRTVARDNGIGNNQMFINTNNNNEDKNTWFLDVVII